MADPGTSVRPSVQCLDVGIWGRCAMHSSGNAGGAPALRAVITVHMWSCVAARHPVDFYGSARAAALLATCLVHP